MIRMRNDINFSYDIEKVEEEKFGATDIFLLGIAGGIIGGCGLTLFWIIINLFDKILGM